MSDLCYYRPPAASLVRVIAKLCTLYRRPPACPSRQCPQSLFVVQAFQPSAATLALYLLTHASQYDLFYSLLQLLLRHRQANSLISPSSDLLFYSQISVPCRCSHQSVYIRLPAHRKSIYPKERNSHEHRAAITPISTVSLTIIKAIASPATVIIAIIEHHNCFHPFISVILYQGQHQCSS